MGSSIQKTTGWIELCGLVFLRTDGLGFSKSVKIDFIIN